MMDAADRSLIDNQRNMKNIVIAVLAVALLAGIGVWAYFNMQKPADDQVIDDQTGSDLPELPPVVATVNGEEITDEDLETAEFQIAASQGVDASTLDASVRTQLRQEALNALVSQALLRQAVADADIAVEAAEIDTQIETIRGQFEDETAFQAALEAEGLTLQGLREQVETELAAQAYLEQELSLAAVTATEEEVQEAYAQLTAGATDAPAFEEVRAQVEGLVIQQKQQELVAQYVAELRADAEVETMI